MNPRSGTRLRFLFFLYFFLFFFPCSTLFWWRTSCTICAYFRFGTDKNMVLTLCELVVSHNQPQKCILWFTCCVLVIYNKKKTWFIWRSLPATLRANSLRPDSQPIQTRSSGTESQQQTALSSLSEKKNMLARQWEIEVYEVEWLNQEWVNPLEQCSSCSGGLPVLIPHESFTFFFKGCCCNKYN